MLKWIALGSLVLALAVSPIRLPGSHVWPPTAQPMIVRGPTSNPADGIVVTGNATLGAQADTAQITLRISASGGAISLDATTLAPIIDALVRAGVDRSAIALPTYMVGQARTNELQLSATLHNPTLPMLQKRMLTMANAFAATPSVILSGATVHLSRSDCAHLSREALATAMAQATSSAAFIAKKIGAHVGPVLAVNASNMGAQDCSSFYSITPFGQPSDTSRGLSNLLDVTVYSYVTMRFAIKR